MFSLSSFLLVFLGGGIGSLLRFSTYLLFIELKVSRLWIATLIVNLLGCLMIFLIDKNNYFIGTRSVQLGVKFGLLGGLTTFSTLSYEVVTLLNAGRMKEGLIVLGLNIFTGIMIGVWIFR